MRGDLDRVHVEASREKALVAERLHVCRAGRPGWTTPPLIMQRPTWARRLAWPTFSGAQPTMLPGAQTALSKSHILGTELCQRQ